LREALAIVDEEGLDARWERHRTASEALIAGLDVLGMKPLVAEGDRLHALTTIEPGDSVDEAEVRSRLLADYDIEISGGIGQLKGRVWRIGTMGVNASSEPVSRLVRAIAEIVQPGAADEAVAAVRSTC
jgi:alanine-glyoxylate transaminase/serine-glyoxylate transaminase/serine-pyruvate transaminase